MSEKEKKKWWQKLFRNYREVFIFGIGFGVGLFCSIFLWYIIMLVVGFIAGYSLNKALFLRKKDQNDKKENDLKT